MGEKDEEPKDMNVEGMTFSASNVADNQKNEMGGTLPTFMRKLFYRRQ